MALNYGGWTVPGMSPLRWPTELELKNYEGWSIFLRLVEVVDPCRANAKILLHMGVMRDYQKSNYLKMGYIYII